MTSITTWTLQWRAARRFNTPQRRRARTGLSGIPLELMRIKARSTEGMTL